ncbi:peptidylprolyl isomerase [Synechococcus sp. BSF8S]|uniref:peptidylprolyl isomerase n=1 Tax=Synechococcales TaxID=1890424 RepID=UPI001628D368|nr:MULTISPECIES: peptidylprolyl isomerase [unclassified Synechococcus]MBC1262183.1 peptidylprolyl isomerase [Synechococcus sp. BSF8S]MBC1265152.1 peptidylprolyl isomerase [Synechococcus sp. BSA11S]MCT0248184.1 peptidylprolyl isomerase [Synechococcus sp. CS-205]
MTMRLSRLLLLGVLLLTPFGLGACAADAPRSPLGCAAPGAACLSGKALVSLKTSRGDVEVELIGDAAPLTAGNFVDLVRRGAYNNTVFHRVVNEPTPFVVQGGDPQSADPKVPSNLYGTGSFVDPATDQPRLIPLELAIEGEPEPRYGAEVLDPAESLQLRLKHDRGALAMARSADPNSASAQFYIALKPLTELDGRYAVFGRVVKGMEVVDKIKQGDRLIKATLVEGGTLVKGEP